MNKVEIILNVKSSSKRKKFIDNKLITINQINNINELISNLVSENVDAYNQKKTDQQLFKYLTQKEIEDTLHIGKVGFNDRKNDNWQNKEEAVETALLAFKDGIIRVFIDDEEIEYNCTYSLKQHANVTFIKMVMLAGRMW